MLSKNSDDHVYFIEAATDKATHIAKTWVSPGEAPVGLTEKEYNACRRTIEHYVKAGTIFLYEPGTKSSARAAKAVKAEQERRSQIVAGGELPPAPRELTPIKPATDSKMPTFSVPGEEEEDTGKMKCVAKTTAGNRCKSDAISKHVVCGMHQRMLKKNKKLEDTKGNRILKNGKDIEPA